MPFERCLAAGQTIPILGDVSRNVADHVDMAEAAGREGAEIVVFPELSLTGYALASLEQLAMAPSDARLAPLAESASRAGLTIVAGTPVRMAGATHIGAVVFMPDGERRVYTKRHLGTGEERFLSAGSQDPLVPLGAHQGSVCVCADANVREHPAAAASRGSDTYLVSSLIVAKEHGKKTTILRGYATAFRMTVVFANYGGPAGDLVGAGRSAVWSDQGHQVVEAPTQGACLVLATRTQGVWSGRVV